MPNMSNHPPLSSFADALMCASELCQTITRTLGNEQYSLLHSVYGVLPIQN